MKAVPVFWAQSDGESWYVWCDCGYVSVLFWEHDTAARCAAIHNMTHAPPPDRSRPVPRRV